MNNYFRNRNKTLKLKTKKLLKYNNNNFLKINEFLRKITVSLGLDSVEMFQRVL